MSRPHIPIDWNRVEAMLVAGCMGTEVAAFFAMHPETFYRRVQEEFGIGFTEYLQQKRSIGDSIIREKQYLKAIGLEKEGDNTLLIWLGKNRLKQSETPPNDASEQSVKQHDELMVQIKELRAQLESKDLTNNNTDNKS